MFGRISDPELTVPSAADNFERNEPEQLHGNVKSTHKVGTDVLSLAAKSEESTKVEWGAKKYKQWHLKSMEQCLSEEYWKEFSEDITTANAAGKFTKKALDWGKDHPEKFLRYPELFRIGILSRDTQFEDGQTVGKVIDLKLEGLQSFEFLGIMIKVLANPEDAFHLFGMMRPTLGKLIAREFLSKAVGEETDPLERFLPRQLDDVLRHVREELAELWNTSDKDCKELDRQLKETLEKMRNSEEVKVIHQEGAKQAGQVLEKRIENLECESIQLQERVLNFEAKLANFQAQLEEKKIAAASAEKDQPPKVVKQLNEEVLDLHDKIEEGKEKLTEAKKAIQNSSETIAATSKYLKDKPEEIRRYYDGNQAAIRALDYQIARTKTEFAKRQQAVISHTYAKEADLQDRFKKAIQQFLAQASVTTGV